MKFSVTILGSSSALPTSERNPTAHALNVHERFFLIDCAEGTQNQIRRFRIPLGKIHHIFISHLHGDHFYGLFGLLSSLSLLGRKVPLYLYGPEPLKEILDRHFRKVVEPLSFPLIFSSHSYDQPKVILQNSRIEVSTFPLEHKIPTVGFLFKEQPRPRNIITEMIEKYALGIKEIQSIKMGSDLVTGDGLRVPNSELTRDPAPARSYAYCSDTRYLSSLKTILHGVDLLYHEATFRDLHAKRAFSTCHSTSRQAAQLAHDSKAKQLIIGHFSARYKDIAPLIEEARQIFPSTIEAVDGLEVEIPFRK